jgi:glutamine phosphoribosylpyrophosphate amidotransferase
MCIIAVVPPGKSLTDEEIKACWTKNDDGAGFAYVNDDGRVIVRKGFMDLDAFMKVYKKLHSQYGEKSPFVVHFRIRSHGALDAERTHPFYIGPSKGGPRPALAHNGILDCVPSHKEKSDTQIFIEKYPLFFRDSQFCASIKEKLGAVVGWNKFAVLFPDKEVVIINEQYGARNDEGVWFSNESFRPRVYDRGWGRGGHVGSYC